MMRCNSSSVKGAFLAALLEPTDALMSALTGDSGIHLRFGDTGERAQRSRRLLFGRRPSFQLAQNRPISAGVNCRS